MDLKDHLADPQNMSRLIAGLKVQIKAHFYSIQPAELSENLSDSDLKNFSKGRTIKVIQDFLEYLSKPQVIDLLKYGDLMIIKYYRKNIPPPGKG